MQSYAFFQFAAKLRLRLKTVENGQKPHPQPLSDGSLTPYVRTLFFIYKFASL